MYGEMGTVIFELIHFWLARRRFVVLTSWAVIIFRSGLFLPV